MRLAAVTFGSRHDCTPLLLACLLSACASQGPQQKQNSRSPAIVFHGVAAGDMSSGNALLWTRVSDAVTGQPLKVALTAQVATVPDFRKVLFSFKGLTDVERAGTIKIEAAGLRSHTRYFYRFVSDDGAYSPVGRLTTAPRDDERVAVRFAFSGDTHGAYRPYPLVHGIAARELDFFVFLGDTMYESASRGSPATADAFANPTQALADYRRKYLENLQPVNPDGIPSLRELYSAQGHYTLLDNHELGNRQFVSGGAPPGDPPGRGADPSAPGDEANGSCLFINRTPGFTALLQAFRDFQPVRERRVSAPGDCRTDNTWQLYLARRWGAHAVFINVDARSYRDIQLAKPDGKEDTGPRADHPGRTMLGATQLAWLERTLLEAQRSRVAWKFVAVSSPIDQVGPFGPVFSWDGPKSWIGGYRAERNRLLLFIAENHIEHVVFLTTDDHLNRVHDLEYLASPGDPGSRALVPGAFTIVAGPIGAVAPDRMPAHDFAFVKSVADKLAADERAAGIRPIGLHGDFPGLRDVYREGHPEADARREPVDFYSADTFNYVTLEVSADGRTLSVDTWGMDSYLPNTFPEPPGTGPPRRLLGFRIVAD